MQRFIPVVFSVVYLILSLYVMAIFIPCSGYGGNGGWATHRNGVTLRPLAYRVLVPNVISVVENIPSDHGKKILTEMFLAMRDSKAGQYVLSIQNKKFPGVSSYRGLVEPVHIYQTGMKMIVVYFTLLAFIGMLYKLAAATFVKNPTAVYLAPIIALLWLPQAIYSYAYTYDFAELFFCSACLYLLVKRQFTTYLLCFALATLNKETSIFFFPFFIFYFYGCIPREQFVRLLLWKTIIYLSIKGSLTIYFMDVPGVLFGYFLMQNLHHLWYLHPLHKAFILSILWLVAFQWNGKPAFLRYASWMVGTNIMAYIIACMPGEYRSFYGSFPVLVLLVTHSLAIIGGKIVYLSRIFVTSRIWVRARMR